MIGWINADVTGQFLNVTLSQILIGKGLAGSSDIIVLYVVWFGICDVAAVQ